MPKGIYQKLSKKQEQFIKDNYLKLPIKTIAKILGVTNNPINYRLKKWGLEIPKEIIEQRKKQSQFSKGNLAFNKGKKQTEYMSQEAIEKTKKTRFKKGNIPHNTNFDGHERITKDGYVQIRVKKGVYRLKHIVEWEKINGPLPDNYCLKCVDDNKLNTSPNNWKLISRVENMLINSKHNYPEEIIPSMVLVNKINKKLNLLENGKK